MKVITVTIKEFLIEGGVIKEGRVLYNELGNEMGTFLKMHPDYYDMFIMQKSNRTSPFYTDLVYVKIKVTPHYI